MKRSSPFCLCPVYAHTTHTTPKPSSFPNWAPVGPKFQLGPGLAQLGPIWNATWDHNLHHIKKTIILKNNTNYGGGGVPQNV